MRAQSLFMLELGCQDHDGLGLNQIIPFRVREQNNWGADEYASHAYA